MKQLTCEVCGGNDLLKQDGVFVCQSCGCKYSADEVKKLVVQISEPVKVEGIQNGDDLFENITSFIRICDYKSATTNIEKMKSLYPDNYKTWIATMKLAIHQLKSGEDVNIVEQNYSDIIASDIDNALILCVSEKEIIKEEFCNYNALVEKLKQECNSTKEELLNNFAKDDYKSLHNFYCERDLSFAESQTDSNLFNDGYIYIFKCDNGQLYLLVYTIKGVGHAHPGPVYSHKYKVRITKNGTVTSNNKPLIIHDKNFQIKDIVFKNGIIDKIIMPELAFIKSPIHNIQNDNVPKGGCYIATSVYGSYDCPEVWTLRRYRDFNLAQTWYGRAFIKTYYAISPTIVKKFGHTEWFKKMWRRILDRMVNNLQNNGVDSTPYEDNNW